MSSSSSTTTRTSPTTMLTGSTSVKKKRNRRRRRNSSAGRSESGIVSAEKRNAGGEEEWQVIKRKDRGGSGRAKKVTKARRDRDRTTRSTKTKKKKSESKNARKKDGLDTLITRFDDNPEENVHKKLEYYWYKLFQGLNRSIDDVYDMCEFVSGIYECDEAIKILAKGVNDMEKLRDRIEVGSSPTRGNRGSIAWEERRSSSPLRNSISNILSKLRALEAKVMADDARSFGGRRKQSVSPRARKISSSPTVTTPTRHDSTERRRPMKPSPLRISVSPDTEMRGTIDGDEDISGESPSLICSPKSAQALHMKLSSPERRKMTSKEAQRRAKEKQETAEKNRRSIDRAKLERLRQQAARVREVSLKKERMKEDQRSRVDEKLRRAQEVRREYIKSIANKAGRENSKVDDVRAETSFIESIVMKDLGRSLQKRVEGATERQQVHIRTIVEKQKSVSKKVARANERRRKNEERIAQNQKKRLEEATRRREELLLLKKKKTLIGARSSVWGSSTSPPRLPAWAQRVAAASENKSKSASLAATRRTKGKRTPVAPRSDNTSKRSERRTDVSEHVRGEHSEAISTARSEAPGNKMPESRKMHSAGRAPRTPKRSPNRTSRRRKHRDAIDSTGENDEADLSIRGQKISKLGMESIPLTKAAKKRCRVIRKRVRERCVSVVEKDGTTTISEHPATLSSVLVKRLSRMTSAVSSSLRAVDSSADSGRDRVEDAASLSVLQGLGTSLAKLVRQSSDSEVSSSTEAIDAGMLLSHFSFRCCDGGLAALLKLCRVEVASERPRLVQLALACASTACMGKTAPLPSPRDWMLTTTSGVETIFGLIELHQYAMCSVERNRGLLEELVHLFTVVLRLPVQPRSGSVATPRESAAIANSQDIVKNLFVCAGVIPKLSQFLGHSASELSSHDGRIKRGGDALSSWSPRLLHNALALLVVASSSGAALERKISESALAQCLKEHVIESIVLLLLSFLMHARERKEDGASLSSFQDQDRVKIDMCRIAIVGFHALVNIARSHATMCQSVLGSSRLQNHFHHLLSQVFTFIERDGADKDCPTRDSDEEMLLHSLLILLAHYCKDSVANQRTLLWGKSPTTTIERMCALPFRYFNEPAYQSILFPALIAACYRNATNLEILSQEMDPSVLGAYVALEAAADSSETGDESAGGALKRVLREVYSPAQWPAISKHFRSLK